MERVKTAVIGVGSFGELHAQAYVDSPLADLQAVVTTTEARVREVGERLGVRWYTDFQEMLEKEDVDAVSISNRDADHKKPAIACARAGKHILLEKPMAPTVEEADDIIAAVEEAGVKMMVNFICRFEPNYLAAHEAIQRGEIGKVISIFGRRNITREAIDTYGKWTDILISAGIHEIDAMSWYANSKVGRVYGESARFSVSQEQEDNVFMALLRMENGTIGNLETSWSLPPTHPTWLEFRMDIVGTKGVIFIDNANKGMLISTEEECTHPEVTYWPVHRGRVGGALREAVSDFLECILEDREPMVGAAEGRHSLEVAMAIKESCGTGKPVQISP